MAEGKCSPGYRDGGEGSCFPRGACSPGYHDGGDESCVPVGTCSEAFELTRLGRCELPGPCSLGIELHPPALTFGRARPGQSRYQLLGLQPAQGQDTCVLEELALASGSAAAFGVMDELPLPENIWAEETAYVLLIYQPGTFGSHVGRVVASSLDPHAPLVDARLTAEATSSPVILPSPRLQVGGLLAGLATSVQACVRNEGSSSVLLERVHVDWRTNAEVRITSAPAQTLVGGGESLCATVEIRPAGPGIQGGTVEFHFADGGLPLVMLLLGSAD